MNSHLTNVERMVSRMRWAWQREVFVAGNRDFAVGDSFACLLAWNGTAGRAEPSSAPLTPYDFAGRPVLTGSSAETAATRRLSAANANICNPARSNSLFFTEMPAATQRFLSSSIFA